MSKQAKLSISEVLCFISIALFAIFRFKARPKCMIAMLLSSLGDCFMIDNHIPVGEYGTFIGAAFFIVAHLGYADCFRSLI